MRPLNTQRRPSPDKHRQSETLQKPKNGIKANNNPSGHSPTGETRTQDTGAGSVVKGPKPSVITIDDTSDSEDLPVYHKTSSIAKNAEEANEKAAHANGTANGGAEQSEEAASEEDKAREIDREQKEERQRRSVSRTNGEGGRGRGFMARRGGRQS